jgi:hypothetical protein
MVVRDSKLDAVAPPRGNLGLREVLGLPGSHGGRTVA